MLIYIAGPYRGNVEENIANARKAAIAVWEAGHVAVCPHLNTAHFEKDCSCTDEQYLNGTLQMLARCDAAIFLWNWQESQGAREEMRYCQEHGIPTGILMKRDSPEIQEWEIASLLPCPHPVEDRSPQQAQAFIETVMKMYRVHLQKNMDYSPVNILGTGQVGSVVRLWDKTARLMNLLGFRLEMKGPATYEPPSREPNYEAVEDTFLDLANYAVIALLLRLGKWGQ